MLHIVMKISWDKNYSIRTKMIWSKHFSLKKF